MNCFSFSIPWRINLKYYNVSHVQKLYNSNTLSFSELCHFLIFMCHFYHNSSLSFSLSVPLLFPLFYPMCLFSISDLRLHLARDNLLNVYSDLVFRFHKKGTQENDEPSRVASQTWNLLHMDLLLAKWGNVTELKLRQVLDVRHSLSLSVLHTI